jgi:replication factor C large subunit
MSPWCEKYRPLCYADGKGQGYAVEKIKSFIISFGIGKKSLILYGPPGTGKTSLAHVVAKEVNSEIFELNASDLRNRIKLQEVLKPAIEQRSLTKERKIILVDEVDGISGTDRGGLLELLALIEKTKFPVIITANDIWDRKFSLLRKKSEMVQLKEVEYKIIKDILINILRKEGLFINNDILTSISIKAKGDIRAAINDLQTIAHTPSSELTPELFDERNKETDIFNALRLIFKNRPAKEILEIFDSVNMPLDEIILWVEENIPAEYHGEELAKAIHSLSQADLFRGRIYKKQYWRFLVYENILLSYGVSASKNPANQERAGFTSYKKPTRILKIWMHNQKTQKKKTIAEKYARYVHVGIKRAMNEFPIIRQVINSNPSIKKELKLNEDEIIYLENSN